MNTRAMIALMLALGLGGAAVWLAWQGLRPTPTQPAARRVVLAAQALPSGTVLRPALLKTVDWPAARGSPPVEGFERADALDGRVLTQDIAADAPLVATMLAPEHGGLTGLMAPGMRAITLHVDQVVGVAGFALPGSRVDVVLTGQADAFKLYGKAPPTGEDRALSQRLAYAKVLLSNVRVLALSQQTGAEGGKPVVADSATLEVTPEQVVTLNLARQLGNLTLVLRRPGDQQTAALEGQIELGLLHTASAPKARAASVRAACVQVYEAGKAVHGC
jgi:pilus assembly protein CpaB